MDPKEIKLKLESIGTELGAQIKEIGEKSGAKHEDTEKKIKELDEKISKQVDKLEKAFAASPTNIPGFGDEEKSKKVKFSIAKAAMGSKTGDWRDAGLEKEMIDQMYAKDMSASEGVKGAFLIPTETSDDIIQLSIARMPIFAMSPTRMSGLVGDVEIPKITARPTASSLGENTAPTKADVSLGEIKLTPKRIAAFTKVSMTLIQQTSGVAEQIVRSELSKAQALQWHNVIINGTGSSSQPIGILNFTGTTTTGGTTAGAMTFKDAAKMAREIDVANMLIDGGSFGYLMRPESKWQLKDERVQQFTAQVGGQPIVVPIMSDAVLEDSLGFMVRTTTQLSSGSTSEVIFGDWQQLILADWDGTQIKVSDVAGDSTGSAFLENQIWIVIQQNIDVNVRDATGLTIITDRDTTVN